MVCGHVDSDAHVAGNEKKNVTCSDGFAGGWFSGTGIERSPESTRGYGAYAPSTVHGAHASRARAPAWRARRARAARRGRCRTVSTRLSLGSKYNPLALGRAQR